MKPLVLESSSISLCLKNELKIFPFKEIHEKGLHEPFLSLLPYQIIVMGVSKPHNSYAMNCKFSYQITKLGKMQVSILYCHYEIAPSADQLCHPSFSAIHQKDAISKVLTPQDPAMKNFIRIRIDMEFQVCNLKRYLVKFIAALASRLK